MKRATKKSLGVVALGTVVAAAGAGVASAAGPTDTLGTVGETATTAVDNISAADLPGEVADTLDATGKSLNGGQKGEATGKTSLAGGETGASAPGGGMLGGIPLKGLPLSS
ncbi:ATP-binding protein [Streptomyces sp. NPDC048172]|uniref:ATP-binding protein n=1 Tax=Streptomyces sp. NPDC048172 TaxID=3365505 RepID=UPI0037121E9F